MKRITVALSVVLTVATMAPPARSLVISPAKGQSAEQQSKDEAECHTLAVEQSGFDPEKATTVTTTQQGRPRAKGAARGAAVGAVGGAIAGDAGTGAAAGAAMGTMAGGMKKRDQARQQKAQTQQAGAAGQASYNNALEACLEGRGYNVK